MKDEVVEEGGKIGREGSSNEGWRRGRSEGRIRQPPLYASSEAELYLIADKRVVVKCNQSGRTFCWIN